MKKKISKIYLQGVPTLSDVESAEVIVLDENGQTANHYEMTVNQYGWLVFSSPWMAGSPNGRLVVKFKDGTLLTYDLASPEA